MPVAKMTPLGMPIVNEDYLRGIVDLQAAIKRYMPRHNQSAKPFIWTKAAAAILDASIASLHHQSDSVH